MVAAELELLDDELDDDELLELLLDELDDDELLLDELDDELLELDDDELLELLLLEELDEEELDEDELLELLLLDELEDDELLDGLGGHGQSSPSPQHRRIAHQSQHNSFQHHTTNTLNGQKPSNGVVTRHSTQKRPRSST